MAERILRRKRIRAKIFGTVNRPRVVVFRSNKNLYLQAIDDQKSVTLASVSTLKDKENLAENFVKLLKDKNIKEIVFDRAGYQYHGKIKKIAEDLRNLGLEF